jgi:hypothetical protein
MATPQVLSTQPSLEELDDFQFDYGNSCQVLAPPPPFQRQRINVQQQQLLNRVRAPTFTRRNASTIHIHPPPWSMEDQSNRKELKNSLLFDLVRTNLLTIGLFLLFLIIVISFENSESLQIATTWVTVVFILIQTVTTCIQAIPDNATSTPIIDLRTTAILFQSMVLYPCLGLWIIEHTSPWTFVEFSNFWTLTIDGYFTWGYVFPFFMWTMTALMMSRETYSPFIQDSTGVVTGENGRPITQLYRRTPGILEVIMSRMCHFLTKSYWHFLSDEHRPASHGGRLFFQLLGPVPLLFIYIGFRFCAYSADQLSFIVDQGYTGYYTYFRSEGITNQVLESRLIVWSAFFFHTLFLRIVLPSSTFLTLTVADVQSLKYRWITWQQIVAPTKRIRLLWAFRGWILALVPYLIRNGSLRSTFWGGLMWYLYLLQYVSFFLEGVLAFWWGVNEASRACHLNHPFKKGVDFFYWAAFNVFLQPVGTAVNFIIYSLNGERAK